MIVSLDTLTASTVWPEPESRATRSEAFGERFPDLGVSPADVACDDDAVLVQNGNRRVPVEPEGAGELDVRVGERRPRPAVLGQERLRRVPVVGDVQAEESVLGMALDEVRVGDRLAVANGSPGGPDVHVHRLPAHVRQ